MKIGIINEGLGGRYNRKIVVNNKLWKWEQL